MLTTSGHRIWGRYASLTAATQRLRTITADDQPRRSVLGRLLQVLAPWLLCVTAAQATTLCVRPEGSVQNGDAACIAIEKLADAVNEWNAACRSAAQPRLTVQFPAGTWRLKQPLMLRNINCPAGLVLQGQGKQTVLSGAAGVTFSVRPELGTTRAGQRIFTASLSALLDGRPLVRQARAFGKSSMELVELFDDRGRLPLARSTPAGFQRLEAGARMAGPKLLHAPQLAQRYQSEPDISVGGFLQHDWADELIPVTSIDGRSGEVGLLIAPQYGVRPGARYFVENSFQDLLANGGWVYKSGTGTAMLASDKRGDQIVVDASSALSAIVVDNSANITVQGIAIEKVRAEALLVRNSSKLSFSKLDIRWAGSVGIRIQGADIDVSDVAVSDVGEAGITVNGGNRKTLDAGDIVIRRALVSNVGRRQAAYMPAINIAGVGNKLLDSELTGGPHSAVVFHGNNHEIRGNHISGFARDVSDSGVIYTGRNWTDRGTIVAENHIEAAGPGLPDGDGVRTIYLDDQASGITVENNVLIGGRFSVFIGGGRDNIIRGNVLAGCVQAIGADARGLDWQKKDISAMSRALTEQRVDRPPYAAAYPALSKLKPEEWGLPGGNTFEGNVITRCKVTAPIPPAFASAFHWAENLSVTVIPEPPRKRYEVSDYLARVRQLGNSAKAIKVPRP